MPPANNPVEFLEHGIFLIMDWEDQDLRQILYGYEVMNFSDDQIKVLVYNLLCAVHFLDTANVMHRDIKPSNLLVTQQCCVKICDFGLARCVP